MAVLLGLALAGLTGCGDDASPADAAMDAGQALDAASDGAGPDAGPTRAACEGPDPRGDPFSEGPYGTGVMEVAGDFTLPTLEGTFSLRERWTGCDSYLFVLYTAGSEASRQLWTSSVSALLDGSLDGSVPGSPDGVHYFFLSYAADPDQVRTDVTTMRDSVEAGLAELTPEQADHWRPRMHFVTTGALDLDGWIPTMLRARPVASFGIDRLQRIRETGLLYPFSVSDRPVLASLASEARYYDFEWRREQRLRAEDATVIEVLSGEPVEGEARVDVTFPDLEPFDTLELDLTLSCPGHLKESCPAWDYIADLKLCDEADPDTCEVQIGRWITPYWAEGRWVTDASGMLALLGAGGPRRLRLFTSQPYLVDLRLRLSNRGKPGRPRRAVYLWSGGPFDEHYNDLFDPRTVAVPAETVHVELYAVITGHGFAGDVDNCAEFCDHTHRFVVGGAEHVLAHPEAGTRWGCLRQVDDGVVPNQSGTWFLGRGGWCPGLGVEPWTVDVTAEAPAGGDVSVTYEGGLRGMPYVPVRTSMDFNASIRMDSYLIFYW